MIPLDSFNSLVVAALPLAALITGLVQVVKATLDLQTGRFLPLVSVLIGAAVGVLLVQLSPLGAIVGIALGLSGTGLYEFGKTTVAGK